MHMLWNRPYYHLNFTDQETETREGEQAAQGTKVMEARLRPGLLPETYSGPLYHAVWINCCNEQMN